MRTYKGFNKDMTCRGFQYEEGKEYTTDGEISTCNNGFHACEDPIDCFRYYAPASSVYHEVEQSGTLDRDEYDSKVASSKIKIGAEVGILGIIKAHIEYVKEHATTKHTDPKIATAGDSGAATAGDHGAATVGDYGTATAGCCGVATAGNCGAATAGDSGVATAGDHGAATAGDRGAATADFRGAATAGYRGAAMAGYGGVATAGDCGAATAGNCGAATSRGSSTVGKNGIACARGNEVKAKGGLGAVLVLVEERKDNHNIARWKAEVVDGERIKADVFYCLDENGDLKECSDGN